MVYNPFKNKFKAFFCLLVLTLLFNFNGYSNLNPNNPLENIYPIIPTPQEIDYGEGELGFTAINIAKSDFQKEADQLKTFFQSKGIQTASDGLKIQIVKEIILVDNTDEAYRLSIDGHVKIWASTEKGAYYAIKTLAQIFRKNGNSALFPRLEITDWPAFKIRGFMHDTGRNFQSVAQLKEQIEVIAQYKYNVFHWHLTDDPGWRLESKLYPQLQSEFATSRHKGKFYTQEDFKDILAFCNARHITVIPEFDIPGHSRAFRDAMGFKSMKDAKALPTLLDLFDELCALASPEEMPYIHIGTDEVRNGAEYVEAGFVETIMERVQANNREVIGWEEGIEIQGDSTSIKQLWAQHPPKEGHRFIDSRANYINHLDPFAGMSRLFFQQPCRQPTGDAFALGGILCAWPDNNVAHERDILKQNPIYPSIVFYADAIWKGRQKNKLDYWAKLPPLYTPEFMEFKAFEEKVIRHRDLFFEGKEFPYVRQTEFQWNVIGPFENNNEVSLNFPVEDSLVTSYKINDRVYNWSDPVVGGTIHLKHFFGFPALTNEKNGTYYAVTEIYSPEHRIQDFWIGFQGWSRSGGRRVGPFPDQGQWHTTHPKIWVNGMEIAPPVWKQPNLKTRTDEIPFIDEDYFYRDPTKIQLKKGWNTVLLKIPQDNNSWKWMFTVVPVDIKNNEVKEAADIKFRPVFNAKRKVTSMFFLKKPQCYARDKIIMRTLIPGIADTSLNSLITQVHPDTGAVTRSTVVVDK